MFTDRGREAYGVFGGGASPGLTGPFFFFLPDPPESPPPHPAATGTATKPANNASNALLDICDLPFP